MQLPSFDWPLLVGLQQRAEEAGTETELAFLIGNETWHLIPYRQAFVFLPDLTGIPQLKVISGLVSAQEDTPYTLWLAEVVKKLGECEPGLQSPRPFTANDLPESLREGWAEWWPAHALWHPLIAPNGEQRGGTVYIRDTPWLDTEIAQLDLLHRHYAYCLQSLRPRPSPLANLWQGLSGQPRRLRQVTIGLAIAALFPVPLSVLAPAEIIALKAETVSAPTDGVVKAFHVQPNQSVKAGQPLFSLDDTSLRNRRSVAEQAMAVARAEALAAGQKAFDNQQSKGELAGLQGKVREKEAEIAYLDELLLRINVVAPHDGIFIYGDPNDWIGKPVATGERIAQLAEPEGLGVLIWVPVGDAISLEHGASIRIYLQVSPLNALSAELIETSYQATLSPDNVASYRIRGKLAAGESAHIGLRGVAKVYGNWRPFIYWALRRPLGALRQWVGL